MLALAAAAALVAQVQAVDPPRRAATDPPPPVARSKASPDVVCHPGAATGRILGTPVCHTRDEWETMARNATAGLQGGPPRSSCRPGMMMGC